MKLPRNAQIWLPGYLRDRAAALRRRPPRRLWVTIADHYEPYWCNTDDEVARRRVARWRSRWPEIAARHRDSEGGAPRYTFFYPQEEYREWLLEPLAAMARLGIADVEVHIHHDGDGEAAFLDRMQGFLDRLRGGHGLLRLRNGKPAFAFIHGNWALDNSRPDGRWCGLNNELTLLRRLGCYADFTMPSASSATQSRTVNTIYMATDDPARPKSFDRGTPLEPGRLPPGDLLMIPGPLGLRWAERLVPRLETGELACYDPPSPYRVRRWFDLTPRIGDDGFLKLFAHGAQERHSEALLGQGALDRTLVLLRQEAQLRGVALRYATAWEMFQAVQAAAGALMG